MLKRIFTGSRRRRRLGLAGAATVLAAAGALTVQTLAAPTASAEPSGCKDVDRYTVCTTFPTDHAPDTAISDEMARHIDHTESGDEIKLAMYLWELKSGDSDAPEKVAGSLVEAKKRGVEVRIVLGAVDDISGGVDRNKGFRDLMKSNGIEVTDCPDSCQDVDPNGRLGAMHNKFFLIKHGGSNNILETSSNLSTGQVSSYQNM
ncbi:MAG: phospholipase D-like domain-containing protein, partial [Stackebrandtia sp.]